MNSNAKSGLNGTVTITTVSHAERYSFVEGRPFNVTVIQPVTLPCAATAGAAGIAQDGPVLPNGWRLGKIQQRECPAVSGYQRKRQAKLSGCSATSGVRKSR